MDISKFLAGFCLATTSLIAPITLLAQSNGSEATLYNKVSIASPTAGSLAKFVDIPVSLHTGIPQISIPLYTIKEGSLSVPISMSYHASGLKTLEPASWVGAGWSLNAGGVITRSVRGTPDEKGTVNEFQRTGFYSDYGYRSHLLTKGWPNDTYGDVRPDSGFKARYEDIANGEYDSEPDLFFFNFGGYTGKFYFNDDRMPVLLPEQDVKIEANYTYGSSESIQGFTITTPDGNKYYFGATPSTDTDAVEFTKVYTDQNGLGWDKVLSSWYLNKIVSADDNNTINLNYRPVFYSYYSMSMAPEGGSTIPGGYKLIRNYIHGVELAGITSSNAQVNFVQAVQARQDLSGSNTTGVEQLNGVNLPALAAYPLGGIDILQKSGLSLLKSYKFNYSYFDDPNGPIATNLNTSSTDKKRLKLLSIQEQSATGLLTPPYVFDYFTEPVPRRLTFGQDHWGFINGVTTNGDKLIGTYYNTYNTTTPTTVTGADRDPHWPAMRGGTLSRITFPTGGYNIYDFEPNETVNSKITGTNGERIVVGGKSVGFDGCDCTKQDVLDLTLGAFNYVFQIKVTNGPVVGGGSLDVLDSNWVPIDHLSVTDGVAEIQRSYAPGLYHFRISKSRSYGGTGTVLTVYQLAGTVENNNAMVGGLRVKTITQNSGNGNPDMVTNYEYNDTYGDQSLSTGVVFGKPTLAQVTRNDIYKDAFLPNPGSTVSPHYADGCPFTPGSGLGYLLSANSVRPMNSSQGSHIGYRKVTTRQTGNGFTVSMFNMDGSNLVSNDDIVNRHIITSPNTCTLNIPNYPAVPEPNAFKRGQLEYQAQYSEDGSLLQDKTYSNEYQDNPLTTQAMVITRDASSSNARSIYSWYEQGTSRMISETTRARLYKGSDAIETTTQSFYDSPYHHQLTRKVVTNSTNDALETRYTYVPDFLITNVDGLDTHIASYVSQLNILKSNYASAMALCIDNQRCKRNNWLDYDIALSHQRMDFINYRIANFTGVNNTYQTRLQQGFTNADATLKPILDLRMQNDLSPVETVSLKNGKVIDATYNTYAYKPLSQNKIYLSKVSKTDFLVPPISFTYTQTGSDNISVVKDAAYNEKATFEYATGNISQVKLTDNVPTAYQWGYNNQYPVLSAKNAKSTNIFFESFEEGAGNGTLNDSKSGHYSYTGTYTKTLTGLDNGGYRLTYYKKVGTAWQWTTTDIPVIAGTYTISLNAQVDDIRFAPATALLTSYTYDPEIGMTSIMDPNGVVTYYEYDGWQRLKSIRDKDKNILKSYCYNYAGQQGACPIPGLYFNTMQSQSFTRNNCTSGTGSSVTYTVPDSTYASTVSASEANNQALADIATNGQSYANTNGTCLSPPAYARIRITSSTSGNPQNYANYSVELFADANMTTPYIGAQNTTVNYQVRTSTSVNNGTPTVVNTNYSTVMIAGSSIKTLGQYEYGCGGGVALMANTTSEAAGKTTTSESTAGGATTNTLPPPGGDTTCITASLTLLPGTGYLDALL